MQKIVINTYEGRFGLSQALLAKLYKRNSPYVILKGGNYYYQKKQVDGDADRADPLLVKLVEGHSRQCTQLVVISIPDDVDWEIQECDGDEWVAEKHRTWGEEERY